MNEQHDLTVSNNTWTVDLTFESWNENKVISNLPRDIKIELNDTGKWTSSLYVKIIKDKVNQHNCLISGIDGGCYLHVLSETDNSQTVKLVGNKLILSMGSTLFALNLDTGSLEWKVRPDSADIFEFYDLENDILLRGEMEIHRIDYLGNVKWSYGGRDIWVNLNGKKEVTIEENFIRLFDFDSNEYHIDFDGNTIKDIPRLNNLKRKKWCFF